MENNFNVNKNLKSDDFSKDRANYLRENKDENFELIEEITSLTNKNKMWNVLFWIGWLFIPFLNCLFLIPKSLNDTKIKELRMKLSHNSINRNSNI